MTPELSVDMEGNFIPDGFGYRIFMMDKLKLDLSQILFRISGRILPFPRK